MRCRCDVPLRYGLRCVGGALFVLMLGMGLTMSISAKPLNDVACEMKVASTVARDSAALVSLHLVNQSKHDVRILRRNTPLEPFFANYLVVDQIIGAKAKPIAYRGPVAKRPIPSEEEYVLLAAGADISRQFNLNPAYDVSAPGQYRISWPGEIMDAAVADTPVSPSNPVAHHVNCRAVIFIRQ